MPKDPMPVKMPDSPPSTPDDDSDSLPEPDVEDEAGLESEVGPYGDSAANLGKLLSLKFLCFVIV